jgi:tripartite-type tricarboxylate transporter receptor subunit TctC
MKKILAAIMIMCSSVAYAWEPPKTVTVVVGNAPGAGNEIAFRKLASIVNQDHPNTAFVVQHMAGADQAVAMNFMLNQPNNGSVLAIPSKMNFVTNDVWQKKSKKFEWDSFRFITTMGNSPLVLVANKSSKVNTPQQFMDKIANTKEQIVVAIGGGAHRTALEYLIYNAKADKNLVKHINYQGPAQALMATMNNETEFGIMPLTIAAPQVEDGVVKIIGQTGYDRLAQYPNIALLNDVAPGIDVQAGWLLIAPPNTSDEIVDWYNAAFAKALFSKEYTEWREKNLITVDKSASTPVGLQELILKLRKTFLPMLLSVVTEGENG